MTQGEASMIAQIIYQTGRCCGCDNDEDEIIRALADTFTDVDWPTA